MSSYLLLYINEDHCIRQVIHRRQIVRQYLEANTIYLPLALLTKDIDK